MVECWHEQAVRRPNFPEIGHRLKIWYQAQKRSIYFNFQIAFATTNDLFLLFKAIKAKYRQIARVVKDPLLVWLIDSQTLLHHLPPATT